MLSHFSCVWLCATPWTVAHQAPLSMGFSWTEYWSRLPCPPPGDLPDPGIEPMSLRSNLHWQVGSSPHVPPGKPLGRRIMNNKSIINMYEISMQSDMTIVFSCTRGSLYILKSSIRLRKKKSQNFFFQLEILTSLQVLPFQTLSRELKRTWSSWVSNQGLV